VSAVLVRRSNSSRGLCKQATHKIDGGNNIYGKLKYVEIKLLTKDEYFVILTALSIQDLWKV
jgi:hypothetical protein